MRHLPAIVTLLVGCYQPSPPLGAPCDDTLPCPSGQRCVLGTCGGDATDDALIVDGTLDSLPDACENPRCDGDTLVQCDVPPVVCEGGCLDGDGDKPHCGVLRPSNGFLVQDLGGATGALDLAAPGGYTFDTTSGTLSGPGGIIALPTGTTTRIEGPYRVLALGSLRLGPGATLRVRGNRALVILAGTTVTVEDGATIDLSGGCGAMDPSCAGPGGGLGAASAGSTAGGCGGGGNGLDGAAGTDSEAGGGGGGFGTAGAFSAGPGVGQGLGGIACGTTMLEPLQGGSGGGVGGLAGAVRGGGRGGGGGGALQLTAFGTITIAGTITAGGGGGESGHIVDPMTGGGGGGGGAGGAILVEALHVAITGTLAANGGGGGGNAPDVTGHGETGRPNTTCAQGGEPSVDSRGGTGGCATALPSSGGTISDRGGGGGAVGRIRVSGPDRTITGATSPAAVSDGGTLE